MRVEESENIKVWLLDVESDVQGIAIETIEAYGDLAKSIAEKELFALRREGKLPVRRGKHMHQDVKVSKNKKQGRVTVGGGKLTGTLWHIVDEGTYRMNATHFIDKILSALDQKEV